MSEHALVEDYLAAYAAQSAQALPTALRQQALTDLQQNGLPTAKNEAWKYTPVKPFVQQMFVPADHTLLAKGAWSDALLPDAYHLVLCNGVLQTPYSDSEIPGFVWITDVTTDGTITPASFATLNTLFSPRTLAFELQQTLTKPLQILHVCSINTAQQAQYPQCQIQIAREVQATIVEQFMALHTEPSYWTNAVTTITLDTGAHLEWIKWQQESSHALHTQQVTVDIAAHANFRSMDLAYGAHLARNDWHVRLLGEHAQCHINGLLLAASDQHLDSHTTIEHCVPHTQSRELYHSIADDKARVVFNGRICVLPQAQKTDSELRNANLLLSSNAEIDTKPELEIYADDVKCAHGATVAQLDPQMAFYLQARGLTPESARQWLIYGFAERIVALVENRSVRMALEHDLQQRLHMTEISGELS